MTEQITPPGKPASAASKVLRSPTGYISHVHWDETLGEYIHTHAIFDKTGLMLPMADHRHGATGNQRYLGETKVG